MTGVDLSYAIGLKPEQAIEYFERKGYVLSWNWHDTWQEAHAKAFTVAKVMRMDVLRDIREMVEKALEEGVTVQQFRKELEPRLKAKGWWGRKFVARPDGTMEKILEGSPWRLRNIYRTNIKTAYMAGRWKAQAENAEARPYWRYVAVMDSKTRPSHAMLNGRVFRYDDPFWASHYPPNGWGCRCRVRALSRRRLKARGLKVESSEGKLSVEDRLVSRKTGELRPVTVYRDPATGAVMAPDPGWSYNPGLSAWQPDLDSYPYDVASRYIEGAITGPDFTRFFEGRVKGVFPVAVLTPEERSLLGSKKQTVLLSDTTVEEHKRSHPDITVEDYRKIPEIVANGEVYQQSDARLIYLWKDGILYRASLKRTSDKLRNYFLSLFKTRDRKADRGVRMKYKRIR